MAFFKLNGMNAIGIGSETFEADAGGVIDIPEANVPFLVDLLPLLPADSVESADGPTPTKGKAK
jgi:hypothetical protein